MKRLSGSLGASVSGVDLDCVEDGARLRRLLHEHLVLVFPDQALSKAGQVHVAGLLGTPTPAHPVVPGDPAHTEILILVGAQSGRNARWHTDITIVLCHVSRATTT